MKRIDPPLQRLLNYEARIAMRHVMAMHAGTEFDGLTLSAATHLIVASVYGQDVSDDHIAQYGVRPALKQVESTDIVTLSNQQRDDIRAALLLVGSYDPDDVDDYMIEQEIDFATTFPEIDETRRPTVWLGVGTINTAVTGDIFKKFFGSD